jgi:hypothetical protein
LRCLSRTHTNFPSAPAGRLQPPSIGAGEAATAGDRFPLFRTMLQATSRRASAANFDFNVQGDVNVKFRADAQCRNSTNHFQVAFENRPRERNAKVAIHDEEIVCQSREALSG